MTQLLGSPVVRRMPIPHHPRPVLQLCRFIAAVLQLQPVLAMLGLTSGLDQKFACADRVQPRLAVAIVMGTPYHHARSAIYTFHRGRCAWPHDRHLDKRVHS